MWQDAGALYEERLAPPPPSYFHCLSQWHGAHGRVTRFCQLSVQSASWSWLLLNRGSSRMSKAPNLHLAMRLLMAFLLCNRNAMLVICWWRDGQDVQFVALSENSTTEDLSCTFFPISNKGITSLNHFKYFGWIRAGIVLGKKTFLWAKLDQQGLTEYNKQGILHKN